jgi:hypothetical protein
MDSRQFFMGWFRRTDVHTTVKKPRIRRDYFAVHPRGELDGYFCFANSGWTDDKDQWMSSHWDGFSSSFSH